MASIKQGELLSPERDSGPEARLLATTERLLAEGEGFTDLGARRIAIEAGVARSTFYIYFRGKNDLLIRLAKTLRQSVFEIVSTWQIDGPNGGLDGLTETMFGVISFYRKHAHLLRAITEAATYDPVIREFWNAELTQFTEGAIASLSSEQRAGRTPDDLDIATAAEVIIWGGDATIARHVTSNDADGDRRVARELALFQWYGAFRRPAA